MKQILQSHSVDPLRGEVPELLLIQDVTATSFKQMKVNFTYVQLVLTGNLRLC